MDSTPPGGPPSTTFAGLPEDVLVVEDDLLISFLAEEMLHELGIRSVRTVTNVTRALELIRLRAPDFAMLDVGLIHENSFAVAAKLEDLKVPFIFITGYTPDSVFPARFAGRTTLAKPYTRDDLLAVLAKWRELQG